MDEDLCTKCQSTCSALHSYAPEDCPLQICNVCQRLKELDARIANVEGLLANLSEERRNLKSTINRHHDPLIHRFPPELVSQIFISFVEVHNSTSAAYTDVWNPLLLLGAVCRGWRDITLSIPELWANVTINVPQEASPLWLEIADVWFRRSGSVPLLLAVKNIDRLPEVWNASRILASKDVFQLLRSHSPRWKSLSLDRPLSIAYALLDGLDVSHIDGLRLSMRTTVRGVGEPVLIPLQAPFAPKSLYIAGYSLLDNVSVRWDRLTSLEAHTIDANELLYMLQQAINLQTLRIGNTTRPKRIPGDPYPEPDIPFTLKSLTSLDVTVSLVKNNILRHLTLPALQNLRYSYFAPAADTDLDVLGELLDRSAPHSLNSFTFLCSTSEDLTKIYTYPDEDSYDKITGVTHLAITVHTVPGLIRMGENLLRPLTTHREKITLPHLQQLDVTAPMLSSTSWSYLCDIIDPESIEGISVADTAASKQPSRMRRPIQRVSVNLQVEWMHSQDEVLIDEASYLRLRKIRGSGVQVNVVANRGAIDVLKAYENIYETNRQQL